ncbi:MAG: hypothetical protein SWH61_17265 [Thermodesulfobacteriota bacterium]|nr:hypothetical protein [Thermodesulfobacteriota bacterium]
MQRFRTDIRQLLLLFTGVVGAGLFVVLSAGPANAHRVMIFAWIEGDRVLTQSKFPGGGPVSDGEIVVLDAAGKDVLAGRTDEQGNFSFGLNQLNEPGEIKIVLKAGMGHQAYWKLTAQEVAGAMGVDAVTPDKSETAHSKPQDMKEAPPAEGVEDTGMSGASSQPPCLTEAQVRAIVSETMDRKLAPVTGMLVRVQEKMDMGIDDVFAGLGYILGLTGAAALVYAGRKNREE